MLLCTSPMITCQPIVGAGFFQGRPVNADKDSYYDLPGRSEEVAALYEHCVRAILGSLNFGEHGLPLIVSGDWNDGINMAGMASGTAAPISTTARRLGRQATPNAGLIPLRRAGRFFRVREIMSVRARPWKRWMSALFAANMD